MNYPYNIGIKGRLVSSLEEAKASIIDFDGSVFYFPDITNQKIYTKQINLDGTLSFKIYELAAPEPAQAKPNFVTKEEFNQKFEELSQKIGAAANKEISYDKF